MKIEDQSPERKQLTLVCDIKLYTLNGAMVKVPAGTKFVFDVADLPPAE